MLTAAIVGSHPDGDTALRGYLEQSGMVASPQHWTPSLGPHPSPGEPIPDVVFLNLSHDVQSCLALAARLRKLRPDVCLIACCLSRPPSGELLLEAMRRGIQDVLAPPIDPAVLKQSLARLTERANLRKRDDGGKLTMLLGAKGGVGTTTVATTIGAQLARLTRKRVVLLDLARPLGHVSLMLDLDPQFSVRDSVENLERLDSQFLRGLLTRHQSGLEVLAGTKDPDEWRQLPVPSLARVVDAALRSSDLVLIDLGSSYSSEWSSILRLARTVICVAEVDVPSLWCLEQHLSKMTSLGVDSERLRIVINRWHSRDDEILKSFEARVKRPVFARIPNDFRQVSQTTSGVPLSENHDDLSETKFQELAGRLAAVAGFSPPRSVARMFARLFS
jgi:pilus assembly protein CpaE